MNEYRDVNIVYLKKDYLGRVSFQKEMPHIRKRIRFKENCCGRGCCFEEISREI